MSCNCGFNFLSVLPVCLQCMSVAFPGRTHFLLYISLLVFQIIADIFNTPVYTIDVANSAPLGGCYRAKMGKWILC